MLSYSRYQQAIQSVPANARKVYEVIPMAEGWSYSQIHGELQRTGHNMRSEVVMAIVTTLREAGLVQDIGGYRFQRAKHKPRPDKFVPRIVPNQGEAMPASKSPPEGAQQLAPTEISALDSISLLAARIRTFGTAASQLAREAEEIASQLDDIAVQVDDSISVNTKELSDLRALRDLMKRFAV